jgi:hypothetical protein
MVRYLDLSENYCSGQTKEKRMTRNIPRVMQSPHLSINDSPRRDFSKQQPPNIDLERDPFCRETQLRSVARCSL